MRLGSRYGCLHSPVIWTQPQCTHLRLSSLGTRRVHQSVPSIELRPTPNPRAQNIAVLGAGLTGLTTAFQLARTIPHAKITIFEKDDKVGGWLNSEILEVDGGEVLFEWGPRALRLDKSGPGLATLGLLLQLQIAEIIKVPKTAPAATNRFIYYPDHLVRLPGPSPSDGPFFSMIKNLYSVLTEPLFRGFIPGLLAEPSVRPRGPAVADESVGSFLSRRFGKSLADNMASAVIHGIYAGDLYNLSARTLLPLFWHAEKRDADGNGVIAEFADLFFKNHSMQKFSDIQFESMAYTAEDYPNRQSPSGETMRWLLDGTSVYTFPEGIQTITRALHKSLQDNPNVTIRTSTTVKNLTFDKSSGKLNLKSSDDVSDIFDYTVSTLSPLQLQGYLNYRKDPHRSQVSLDSTIEKVNESVDVMVVNLYYSDPELIPQRGFGYLIPRSVPLDQNPERALGVLFSSETSGLRGPNAVRKLESSAPERSDHLGNRHDEGRTLPTNQDDSSTSSGLKNAYAQAPMRSADAREFLGQDTAPGTKLTVMLGGHWWKGWTSEDMPTEEDGIGMARSVLARHLNITEAPALAKARLNKSCIPQYRPGYRQHMAMIHNEVLEDFQGRLKLAGTWWQGAVGVNDCVRKARLTAFAIREGWDEKTGLEDYCGEEKYIIEDTRTGKRVMDPLQ